MQQTALLLAAWITGAVAFRSSPQHLEQGIQHFAGEADRVSSLPGHDGKLDFDMFAGYVTVDEAAGRALYYVLTETKHEHAPLVLWLNGGPGCSSIAGGLMSELGPFYPTASDKLVKNQWAWNRIANVVFLDSPAFVGWSYSNTSADATVGDARTAQDSYVFIKGFLKRFPYYKGRPFWIAGESYAGHYVPQLTVEALEHQDEWAEQGVNLQGFLLGDPLSDPASDDRGAVEFWHAADIISDETYQGLRTCNFSEIYPLNEIGKGNDRCASALQSSFLEFREINIYQISADSCLRHAALAPALQLAAAAGHSPRLLGPYMAAQAEQWRLEQLAAGNAADGVAVGRSVQPGYDPCIDLEVETYLNRPEVQAALNANTSGTLPGPWHQCTSAVHYSREDVYKSTLPQWRRLLESDLRFLVYTGDQDGILPHLGTRLWIDGLQLPIRQKWRAWHSSTGQVGGHAIVYGPRAGDQGKGTGLTYATVRGAGHMVPYTQAERAFSIFERWIAHADLL